MPSKRVVVQVMLLVAHVCYSDYGVNLNDVMLGSRFSDRANASLSKKRILTG
jgi:hypothetical protein